MLTAALQLAAAVVGLLPKPSEAVRLARLRLRSERLRFKMKRWEARQPTGSNDVPLKTSDTGPSPSPSPSVVVEDGGAFAWAGIAQRGNE